SFSIKSNDVKIANMTISNPEGSYAIHVDGVDGVQITDNVIKNIGTGANGYAQGIYVLGGVTDAILSGNQISNNGNVNSTVKATNKGIYVGDSNSPVAAANIVIKDNIISGVNAKNSDVYANGGRGAYGILVNHETTGLEISENEIFDLSGFWV